MTSFILDMVTGMALILAAILLYSLASIPALIIVQAIAQAIALQ